MTGLASSDGDSVMAIDSLLRETLDRRAHCQVRQKSPKECHKKKRVTMSLFHMQGNLDRADSLVSHASRLMEEYAESPVVLNSVRPKSVELKRMSQTLRELFAQRVELLDRARDLYIRIEKANRWCSHGVDLLASQQLEKCSSPEFASQALADIEDFLASAAEFRDPNQFRFLFQDIVTPDTKALTQQVIQRLQDVQVMCERRVNGLRQLVMRTRMGRPVQSVAPEPSSLVLILIFILA